MSQPTEQDMNMRAAEYVLGTLAPQETAQVTRELENNHTLQAEVAYWEEQLGQLALALPPVEPPQAAWTAISARINEPRTITPQSEAVRSAKVTELAAWRRPLFVWQSLTAAASVAALVLSGVLLIEMNRNAAPVPAPTYASMFYDQPSATGWMLTANTASGEMSVTAVGDYPLPTGKELRLWVIPPGGKPIASGLIPAHGKNSWVMSSRVAQLLHNPATVLAVSMEVTGQPTRNGAQGPIMWQAPVRQRS